MRRLVNALAAAALLPAGLLTSTAAASAPTAKSSPGLYQVEVARTQYCGGTTPYPCETTLTASILGPYTNERTNVAASLVNIASGAAVGLDYSTYPSNDALSTIPLTTQNTTLPAGPYLLSITTTTPGKYECSEYYEDGCVWFDDDTTTTQWKFNYDGYSTSSFPQYTAPSTTLAAKVRERKDRFVASGKATGNTEMSNYALTPAAPLSGRKVAVEYMRYNRSYKLVKSGYTNGSGKFKVVVKNVKGEPYRWRVTVQPSAGSPGAIDIERSY